MAGSGSGSDDYVFVESKEDFDSVAVTSLDDIDSVASLDDFDSAASEDALNSAAPEDESEDDLVSASDEDESDDDSDFAAYVDDFDFAMTDEELAKYLHAMTDEDYAEQLDLQEILVHSVSTLKINASRSGTDEKNVHASAGDDDQ